MENRWMSLGALGTAVLASSCCLGPLVLGALGLGAIGAAGVLERFRPYLIVLALLVLGLAFYRTYRRDPAACEGGTCATRKDSKWNRIGLWIVAITVLTILSFPSWSPLLLGEPSSSEVGDHVLRFTVDGMICTGCALTVQRALTSVPGVASASVDFDSALAQVTFGKDEPIVDSLTAAVKRAGYDLNPAVAP